MKSQGAIPNSTPKRLLLRLELPWKESWFQRHTNRHSGISKMISPSFREQSLNREALEASPDQASNFSEDDKVAYFHRKAVSHPKLMKVLTDLEGHIFPSTGAQVVLLVGPPGVGKSRAIEELTKRMLKRYLLEMKAEPGFLPIVVMDAGSSGDKAFSWKNFYTTLQRRLGGQVQSTISGLRDGVENSLHWRNTKVLVIDEGKHLFGSLAVLGP